MATEEDYKIPLTDDENEPDDQILASAPLLPQEGEVTPEDQEKLEKKFQSALRTNLCGIVTLSLIALFTLAVSVLIMTQAKPYVESRLNQQLAFDSPDAGGYKLFTTNAGGTPDDPIIKFDLYVFNVENPREAAFYGEKLRVREVGPYAFKEYRVKHNVSYTDDGNIVHFYEQRYYVFDQERSGPGLKENDTFVTPNLAFQGFWYNDRLKSFPGFIKSTLGSGILCETWRNGGVGYNNPALEFTPFVEAPVTGHFFGYFNDPFLTTTRKWMQKLYQDVSAVSPDFPGLSVENYTSAEDTLRRTAPSSMWTGKDDPAKRGKYIKYMNMSTVWVCPLAPPSDKPNEKAACPRFQADWTEDEAKANHWVKMWKTDEAGQIRGTDCIHWPRGSQDPQPEGYVDPIFRTAKMQAKWDEEKPIPQIDGIPAMKFGLRLEDMQNSTTNPANDGFWAYGPNGFFNVTNRAGFPFFVSKPHFLDADSWLVEAIDGVHPDRAKHDTEVYKSSLIGTTVGGNESVQLNVFLRNMDLGSGKWANCLFDPFTACCSMKQSSDWPANRQWNYNTNQSLDKEGIYVPVVWVKEAFSIPESLASQIKLASTMETTVPKFTPIIGFPIVGVCIIGLVVLIVQRIRILRRAWVINHKYVK